MGAIPRGGQGTVTTWSLRGLVSLVEMKLSKERVAEITLVAAEILAVAATTAGVAAMWTAGTLMEKSASTLRALRRLPGGRANLATHIGARA
jgi:hypothetical protein